MLRVQVLFEQVALIEADIAVVEVQHQLVGHADHFFGHATRIPQGFTGIDELVGEHEADVKKGKVSIASPIARAMISKEVGDVVEVNTPGGVKAYEILKVEWK